MGKYDILESELNKEGKRILRYIREDYYEVFSEQKKQLLDNLLNSDKFIIVDEGFYFRDSHCLAYGGGAKGDGMIHFYPDCRNFPSNEAALSYCKKILPHEIFHYFVTLDGKKEL